MAAWGCIRGGTPGDPGRLRRRKFSDRSAERFYEARRLSARETAFHLLGCWLVVGHRLDLDARRGDPRDVDDDPNSGRLAVLVDDHVSVDVDNIPPWATRVLDAIAHSFAFPSCLSVDPSRCGCHQRAVVELATVDQ